MAGNSATNVEKALQDVNLNDLPALQMVVRHAETVSVYAGPPKVERSTFSIDHCREASYSADGSLLIALLQDKLSVYDGHTHAHIRTIEGLPGANMYHVSPRGGYVAVHQKTEAAGGEGAKNVKVFRLSDGVAVLELCQKQVQRDAWPTVQFGGDDSCVVYNTTNTVHVMEPRGEGGAFVAARGARIEGIAALSVSPAPSKPYLAAYVPEVKGKPAVVLLLDYSKFLPSGQRGEGSPPLARRAFFRCQSVRFSWSALGTAVLALSESSVDATNKSYYGEQALHFMGVDGVECPVPLGKEGPVYDVQWSPRGEEFVVVHGFMPAKAILFDTAARPRFDFGTGPYNTVRWSPHSRFLILAGFGNLPGDIHFFDRKADLKCKPMGQVRCPSVVCQWSPCGRYLLTGITAPRLRVDNGLKLFSYFGQEVSKEAFPVLYDASWRPAPPGTYPDRPQSPQRLRAGQGAGGGGGGQGGSGAAAAAAPASSSGPAPAYVPPHLRGKEGAAAAPAASNAGNFSLAYDKNDQGPRKISLQQGGAAAGGAGGRQGGAANPPRHAVPGFDFVPETTGHKKGKRK